ncbi:MAG: MFS transporter [Puniceicoccaceae bacterium]
MADLTGSGKQSNFELNPFREWNRSFTLLAIAMASVGVFFGIQLTLFNNFIVERLAIEPHELGYMEALREVPGFLNFLFLAIAVAFYPPMTAAFCLVLMGLGIAGYASVGTVGGLIFFSVVWSIGFHCWVPLSQSMALLYSPSGKKGRWLGQLRSVESFAWLVTIGIAILLFDSIGYNGLFVLAATACVIGGCAVFFADKKKRSGRERAFVLKRRYTVYYALQFLQGWRKQMFITFAIFALVKVHGMPVQTTMVLVLINQFLVTLTGPTMGRLVDRFGERTCLSWSYVGLAMVFLGYAFIENRPVLYVLYCVDNLLFVGGIALTTYLNRIALPEDLKPTLSMGVTWNHVSSVAAPLIGGFAWHFFGYQVIFVLGALLALVSLAVSQFIQPDDSGPDQGKA